MTYCIWSVYLLLHIHCVHFMLLIRELLSVKAMFHLVFIIYSLFTLLCNCFLLVAYYSIIYSNKNNIIIYSQNRILLKCLSRKDKFKITRKYHCTLPLFTPKFNTINKVIFLVCNLNELLFLLLLSLKFAKYGFMFLL